MKAKQFFAALVLTSMFVLLASSASAGLLCRLSGNETADLRWGRNYEYWVDTSSSTTNDQIRLIKVAGNSYYDGALGATTTNYQINTTLAPSYFGYSELSICNLSTVNVAVNCTFYNATSGATYNVSNETAINMSSTLSGCLHFGPSQLTRDNITISAISDNSITFSKDDTVNNGTLIYRYKPATYNSSSDGGVNALRCVNADVIGTLVIANDTNGMINTTLTAYDDSGTVTCAIDSKIKPTAPTSIDAGALAGLLAGAAVLVGGGYAANKVLRRRDAQ